MSTLASKVQGRIANVFAFSLVLKIFTFSLGVVLTRAMLPEHKGLSFTFEVYSATIGFLSREAVRCTAARVTLDPTDIRTIRKVASVSLITLPLGFVVSGLAMAVFLRTTSSEVLAALHASVPFSMWGVMGAFLLGQFLDLASEPLQGIVRATMDLKVKAYIEAWSLGAKLVTTLLLVKLGDPRELDPAMALGIGWINYGLAALVASYWIAYRSALPARIDTMPEGDARTFATTFRTLRRHGLQLSLAQSVKDLWAEVTVFQSFFVESILRLVLTEGEKFVLNSFAALEEQGIFEVVSNLGSLVARIVFRVWEDALFLAVSAHSRTLPWTEKKQLLKRMLQWSLYLGVLFVVCGPPNAKTFLTILYSSQWGTDQAATVLSWYCYYVPLLGVNGICEAYVRASAAPKDFQTVRRSMVGSSVLYLVACYGALEVWHLGASGVILASCASMVFRIAVSLAVVKQGNPSVSWSSILDVLVLPWPVMASAVATFIATRVVASTVEGKLSVFLTFGVAPVFLLVVLLGSDPEVRRYIRRRRGAPE